MRASIRRPIRCSESTRGSRFPTVAASYGNILPDRIVIYRRPLLAECQDRNELIREIQDTVVHEIGHYFGLDEDDLP